jgi:phosphate starvation-inducible membrane PsiE
MQYLEWLILGFFQLLQRTDAVLVLELVLYFLLELLININTVISVIDVKSTHGMWDDVVLFFFFFLFILERQQLGAATNLRASSRTYA